MPGLWCYPTAMSGCHDSVTPIPPVRQGQGSTPLVYMPLPSLP